MPDPSWLGAAQERRVRVGGLGDGGLVDRLLAGTGVAATVGQEPDTDGGTDGQGHDRRQLTTTTQSATAVQQQVRRQER